MSWPQPEQPPPNRRVAKTTSRNGTPARRPHHAQRRKAATPPGVRRALHPLKAWEQQQMAQRDAEMERFHLQHTLVAGFMALRKPGIGHGMQQPWFTESEARLLADVALSHLPRKQQ
jgi:hypothetical protein